jgi:hypothetical protein
MKVCERCGVEIGGRDGDNHCAKCAGKLRRSRKANAVRRERAQTMRDLGLVRVKGSLGGVYWE